ncbi:hypothetical protein [Glacieibacterium frigidum]|uniref:Uncharacterized protein n=1 Tax=Glacieibacterium frigidum TaxID=2593303 RepID=A0A552UI05_9SPHN|nr:hypothetical protein [Glacieibacterium frigidum]TRW17827.1 hypothetical protein FMM06_06770 [Glacieibacterium frigidum]
MPPDPAAPFDKERFAAFLALATFRRDLRERRIARQWQASFAAWGGLAALVWKQQELGHPYLVAAAALLAAIAHASWLIWHGHRAEGDQAVMHVYHDKATALLGAETPRDIESGSTLSRAASGTGPGPGRAWFNHPAVWLQLATTVMLAGICITLAFTDAAPRSGGGDQVDNAER